MIRDEHGEPDYFLSVFQDVTNQKKVEEQVRIQASKLNAIFESSTHIIWSIDKKIRLTSYNQNFKNLITELYGVEPSIGLSMTTGKLVSTTEYNKYWEHRYEEAYGGIPQIFETEFVNASAGTSTWWEIYLNPIYDANNRVIEVSGIGHDITEKKLAEDRIKSSLREKEVLLKEVHHRVKNNLQVISSILNLQSSYVKDPNTLEMLRESQDRIKSMSFIHESLYQAKDFSKINFGEYIINLSKNLLHSYRVYESQVTLGIEADTVFVNLDYAIPCGLVINELVSNAFKYAFPDGRAGRVVIRMIEEDQDIVIEIEDNGVGLPASIDYRNTESLGLQLVCTLVDQLNGQIKLDQENGSKFRIWFKKNQKII
jgi:PAS domain S-box-containing protein